MTAEEEGEFEKRASWTRMAQAKRLGALVLHAIPFQQIKIIIGEHQAGRVCARV